MCGENSLLVQFWDRGCVVKIVCTVLGQGMCGENSLYSFGTGEVW